ncbi:MAG TPA: glycosyltransferase family A protein [Aggregatilineales bacterium]|nr:glycosyltransferase family 2 protein [Anaerolineales bacterium]HRE49479.1 glycosyltransferase family A protein [Aggregatilineales bacterium]
MSAGTQGKPPRVSVIVAAYNWSSVLRLALRTVLWQTFTDFEALVIGDHCTDDSEAVVASFNDPRLIWHNLPENIGNQAGGNQVGLFMARGEYTAYMHQDDLWTPKHLEVLVAALETTPAHLAYTYCLQVSPAEDNPEDRIRRVLGMPNTGRLTKTNRSIMIPTIMHRTERGRTIGGWGNWRATPKRVTFDFIERVMGEEESHLPVPEITVIKFNSAERRNSYIEKPSHEQADFLARLENQPDFWYRELILAVDAHVRDRLPIRALPPRPENAPPGWGIAYMRYLRGLEPAPPYVPPAKPRRVRRVARRIRKLIPNAIRSRVAAGLTRVGRFFAET